MLPSFLAPSIFEIWLTVSERSEPVVIRPRNLITLFIHCSNSTAKSLFRFRKRNVSANHDFLNGHSARLAHLNLASRPPANLVNVNLFNPQSGERGEGIVIRARIESMREILRNWSHINNCLHHVSNKRDKRDFGNNNNNLRIKWLSGDSRWRTRMNSLEI